MSVRFTLVFALLFVISRSRVTTQGHADEFTTQSSLLGEGADITKKALKTFETADDLYRHGTRSSESSIAASARFHTGTIEHSPLSPVEPPDVRIHTNDPNRDNAFQIKVNDFRDDDETAQNKDGQLSHTDNHATDSMLAHKQTPVMKFSGRVKKPSKVRKFESVKRKPAMRPPPKRKGSKQLAAQVFRKAKTSEDADGMTLKTDSVDEQLKILTLMILKLQGDDEVIRLQVGFTVRFSKDPVSVEKYGIYIFDHVVSNLGNAYNIYTGIFTAPVSGLYALHVNFMSTNDHPPLGLVIQKNGEDLGYLWARGSGSVDSQSSTTVTTFMQRGQQAWVKHRWGSTAVRGNEWSAFSGFLVNPQ